MGKKDDDRVGYKRPPKKNQFKKGQSGNPKGRPKRKNLKVSLKEALNEKVLISEGGMQKEITMFEAAFKRLLTSAISGDMKAAKLTHAILLDTGCYKKDIDDFEKALHIDGDDQLLIIYDEQDDD